jgi:hypothetical protein
MALLHSSLESEFPYRRQRHGLINLWRLGASNKGMEAVMENDNGDWKHQKPGIKQVVCAWAIVAVLTLFFMAVSTPVSVVTPDFGQAARFQRAFDGEQDFEVEEADDIDQTDEANRAPSKSASGAAMR